MVEDMAATVVTDAALAMVGTADMEGTVEVGAMVVTVVAGDTLTLAMASDTGCFHHSIGAMVVTGTEDMVDTDMAVMEVMAVMVTAGSIIRTATADSVGIADMG